MKLGKQDIQDILSVLEGSSYKELHIELERFRLSLRRHDGGTWTQVEQVLPKQHGMSGVEASAATGASSDSSQAAHAIEAGMLVVRPPLLGIFYRSPKPGSPSFVEIGSQVTADTVIGIVETMKLMNTVYAGVAGTVVEICTQDGQFADENSILMLVAPEKL